MPDILIARQPIFDARNQLAGYELLYRAVGAAAESDAGRQGHALIAGLLTVGFEQLVGDTPAYVRFPHPLLLDRAFELLDPQHVAIELTDPFPADDEALGAIAALRAAGFTLAVGAYATAAEFRPVLRLAQLMRVDATHDADDVLAGAAQCAAKYGLRLLTDHVDDARAADTSRALGASLYQGKFFSRPQIVKRRDLPTGVTGIARVMNAVQDPTATDRAIEEAFRVDPGLSLRLLRLVNSAAIGGVGIESIQHAVRLIGRTALHRWLSVLFSGTIPQSSDVERELVVAALARGRLCELLAINDGDHRAAPSVFLTGLLSAVDAMLGVSPRELLRQVHVSLDVEAALLHDSGPYARYLALARLYGQAKWDDALVLASELDVVDDLPIWYAQAGAWARNMLAA